MKNEIEVQRNFWDREASAFEKIYSRRKSQLSAFLDQVFRRDMYERFVFTIEVERNQRRLDQFGRGLEQQHALFR